MSNPQPCKVCGKPAAVNVTGSGIEGPHCTKCADLLGVPPFYREEVRIGARTCECINDTSGHDCLDEQERELQEEGN